MDLTAGMRQASQDPRIKALDGIVTASAAVLEVEPGERTKGVIRQVLRLVTDERARLADEILGITPEPVGAILEAPPVVEQVHNNT